MKIVLDFDDTVFNTHQMMGDFIRISKKAGFTEDGFWVAYQKCKEKLGDLDINILVDFLYQDFVEASPSLEKKEIIKEMNLILSRTKDFIYFDFFDFVNNFHKKDLFLLSFGTTDLHKRKIQNSGIEKFLSEIIITLGNKAENFKVFSKKYDNEKIFFIDDKADQIDQVKKEFPQIITFKMERSQGKNVKIKSELADYVVKNLDEAKKIINELNK